MQMVQRAREFDVIVTNNMFGDIVTDLGAALQGGLGMAGLGQHPSRPDLDVRAGPRLGAASTPARTRQSDGRHPHRRADARLPRPRARPRRRSSDAVARSLREGQTTPDLGGSLTTSQVGDLLARAMGAVAAR